LKENLVAEKHHFPGVKRGKKNGAKKCQVSGGFVRR